MYYCNQTVLNESSSSGEVAFRWFWKGWGILDDLNHFLFRLAWFEFYTFEKIIVDQESYCLRKIGNCNSYFGQEQL